MQTGSRWLRVALVIGSLVGTGIGTAVTVQAQSWPNQCWNNDGGQSCPVCGGTCKGGQYLCCNNGGQQQ
jgi:hypothetical protein